MTEIEINQERCKGCDLCLNLCPKKVFQETKETGKQGFKIREPIAVDQCSECGLCKYLCPEGAIILNNNSLIDEFWEKSKKIKEIAAEENQTRGGWEKIKTLHPGRRFISGNIAFAWAILDVGADYVSYPITPISEALHELTKETEIINLNLQVKEELEKNVKICRQAESEDSALMMLYGDWVAGRKVATGTSDPGVERMLEGLSYGLTNELGIVIGVAQRTSPSTGRPTGTGAGLVRGMRWGPAGGTEHIILYPSTVQEIYNYTVKAFNLAEKIRVPVILMFEASSAHLEESIEIPSEIDVFNRVYRPAAPPFGPTEDGLIPSAPRFGDGEFLNLSGLTHNPEGVPCPNDPQIHEEMVEYQRDKIFSRVDELTDVEEYFLDDAEIMLVAYGHTARSVRWAVERARKKEIKAGMLKLNTISPFSEKKIEEWSAKVKCVVVPEMNQSQLVYVVKEVCQSTLLSLTQSDGEAIQPARILEFLEKDLKKYYRHWQPIQIPFIRNPPEWQRKKVEIPEKTFDSKTIFCPGCGLGILRNCILEAIKELDQDVREIVAVSGIGCTSRLPNHLAFDSANTTHGYAVAFASGVKLAPSNLRVFIPSGDGDLFNIGLGQTLHGAKRNSPMAVICFNNFNFGMTGGQRADTTPFGAKTATTPFGSKEKPFDLVKLILASNAEFAARCPISKPIFLKKLIKEAMSSEKFTFIEVISPCLTHYARRNKLGSPAQVHKWLNNVYISKEKAKKISLKEMRKRFETAFPLRKDNSEIEAEELLQIIYGKFSSLSEYIRFIPRDKK